MVAEVEAALSFLASNREKWLQDLEEFLRFQSVAVDPSRSADVEMTVQWLIEKLEAAGFKEVERLETDGQPVIMAELKSDIPDTPTILAYAHYDVQPPDPADAWKTPPFEPTLSNEYLYGRGAADMKGQLMAFIAAVEAWNQAGGCPLHIKVLIEGEEELGSPNLGKLVSAHQDRLAADLGLNLDAGMISKDYPTITTALRGAMLFDVVIQGPDRDLHSGIFGGLVTNPIHVLCRLLSGLQDEMGLLTLPGMYDQVRSGEHVQPQGGDLSEEALVRRVGVAGLEGDQGFTPFERTTIRPSLDVLHIYGGERRTAIPSQAGASISMRIVPDQEPAELHRLMMNYFEASVPDGVQWNLHWRVGVPPVEVDPGSPVVQAMARALKKVWGREPEFLPGGGTIPVVPMLQEILGIESVLTGFSLPDDNMHGPDERVHLPTLERGKQALVHFFHELSGC
jgi:acetylornithine deacetylase/succinyl-diaminopimelate desuccinylase-like protein